MAHTNGISRRTTRAALALLIGLAARGARGDIVAFDSAADSAYNGGWTNGSNGGFGWGGGWGLDVTPSTATGVFLIASSTTNGGGDPGHDGDIDSAGRAFGTRAFPPPGPWSATASRGFKSALAVGQMFAIDLDNGPLADATRSFVELGLTVPLRGDAVDFRIGPNTGGKYFLQDKGGARDTGIASTDQGLHLVFTLTGATSYSLRISGVGTDGPAGLPKTFTGELPDFARDGIKGFRLINLGAGFGQANRAYINNPTLSSVPEPTSAALLGLGGAGLLAFRRGRRASSKADHEAA